MTLIVAVELPTVATVPATLPVLGLSVRPTGSAPEAMDHVKGGVPPVDVIVVE